MKNRRGKTGHVKERALVGGGRGGRENSEGEEPNWM
jgi:hypothetical protein